MRKTLDNIVTNFQRTGNCEVDVDLVCKKWNYTWFLSQWVDNTFTLCKQLRIGTSSQRIKVTISVSQADEIIQKLNLDKEGSMFRSARTWRQSDEYWTKLRAFNSKKKNASELLPILDRMEREARTKI
jgi:uncharacterized protein (UPF0333 family)